MQLQDMCARASGSIPSCIATSLAFYRSQKGLSLENSEKSPKRGSRGREAPGVEKTRKRLENYYFQVFFEFSASFQPFFDFFRAFSTPGPRGPGNPFSDFFRSFPGRGPFDSCRRPTMSYTKQMDAAVLGDRLREVTQQPFLGPGSLSLRCWQ